MPPDPRDRIPTPFFPLPRGQESTDRGIDSPPGTARELIGQVIGDGRFIVRRKTGHSRTTVRFAAHDMIGGMEVELALNPDSSAASGFRMQLPEPAPIPDLPDLCRHRDDLTGKLPIQHPKGGLWRELWRSLSDFFRGR